MEPLGERDPAPAGQVRLRRADGRRRFALLPSRAGRRALTSGLAVTAVLLGVSAGVWVRAGRGGDEARVPAATAPTETCRRVALAYLGQLSRSLVTLGDDQRNGMALAVTAYNETHRACPVTIKEYDTRGDAARATALAGEIATDRTIVGVLGPTYTDEVAGVAPVLTAAGLVTATVSATGASTGTGSTLRLASADGATQAAAIVAAVTDTVASDRVFLLTEQGRGTGPRIADLAAGLGKRVVGTATVRLGGTYPTAAIRAAKSTAVVCACGYLVVGALLPALRAAALTTVVLGGDAAFDRRHPVDPAKSTPAWAHYQAAYAPRASHFRDVAFDLASLYLAGIERGATTRAALLRHVDAARHSGRAGSYAFTATGRLASPPTSVWSTRVQGTAD